MKVLICGLGSIGQRHVRILRTILGHEAEIGVVRFRKRAIVINDDMTAVEGVDPVAHYGLVDYASYDDAFKAGQQVVFVTNPISMHVDTALRAARNNCHLFIEKPLSHDLNGVTALCEEVKQRHLTASVGYQLRFHPMLEQVRNLIREGAIGDVISADVHFGEWLPGMHPYEDYRESHAARQDQGGGVILALSHEIDLVAWLFGMPASVAATGGCLTDLEMVGVEDTADILLTYEMGGRNVPVHVHLDFVQRPPRRRGLVLGTRGSLEWDYFLNELKTTTQQGGARLFRFDDFRRNIMFERQASDFFDAIRTKKDIRVPLSAGIETLKICLAARHAMQHRTIRQL
jgi:predicted dehydrogenase